MNAKLHNPVIPSPQKTQAQALALSPCLNCGTKITEGYYGRFGEGGVCSKTCNSAQELKPRNRRPDEV